MSNFSKFTSFDNMITPTIIKILFWIGVIFSVFVGLTMILSSIGFTAMNGNGGEGLLGFLGGLVFMAVGILVTRVYCELLIVFFKMNESLTKMNDKLDQITREENPPLN